MQKWILVISRATSLEAIVDLRVMGFRAHVPAHEIAEGDQFLMYLTTLAFGNPSTGVSRLVGAGRFVDAPVTKPIEILGEEYPTRVSIGIDAVIEPLQDGIPFKPFIPDLEFIVKKHVWPSYLRKTIVPITERDFRAMKKAVLARSARNP